MSRPVVQIDVGNSKPDYCNMCICNCIYRYQRARPIIVDPGLYDSKKSGVYWVKEKRSVPASFKLFTGNGSSFKWIQLSLTFCIPFPPL